MPSLVSRAPPWTRAQCAPLEASGLIEKERLELIEGDLIGKTGKNRPHVNASMLLLEWLQQTSGKRFVKAEAPIDVNPGDNLLNEPVPDLIVLKREYSTFTSANPQPQDVNLVAEIADSSLLSTSPQKPLFTPAPA